MAARLHDQPDHGGLPNPCIIKDANQVLHNRAHPGASDAVSLFMPAILEGPPVASLPRETPTCHEFDGLSSTPIIVRA